MTSPSSYVFYHRTNPTRVRQEATLLTRVFITDKKVTVYNKMIVKTSKSGVLFEKITGQQTFSVHENRHGESYLKRLSKSAAGSITDTSLEAVMNTRASDNHLVVNVISDECRSLVENTILGWFGYDPSLTKIKDVHSELLFPSLRDASFPRGKEISKTFLELQASSSLVTKALRENNSWDSFVMDICHPTISTMDDVSIIQNHPNELLPVAIMELPVISVLYESDREALLNLAASFQLLDRNIIKFMFSNLPLDDRFAALQAVLGLSRIHAKRHDSSVGAIRHIYLKSELPLKRVPSKLRPELAQKLFKNLMKTHDKFQAPESMIAFQDAHLCLDLPHVFRYWFAQNVLEPQLQTVNTLDDLEARFMEMFGVPLHRSSIRFHKAKGVDFCSLHMLYSPKGNISRYDTDLFASLSALVVKKRPQDRGTGVGYSMLNGYVADDRLFVNVGGGLYSLDDIMSIIELGVAVTDAQLTKLGRKITPENRTAFLTLGSKERKFKNTWKYYDWGVIDPAKILALKASKVTKKEDVQTYNQLPEEMFNELLALESGKEFNSIGY